MDIDRIALDIVVRQTANKLRALQTYVANEIDQAKRDGETKMKFIYNLSNGNGLDRFGFDFDEVVNFLRIAFPGEKFTEGKYEKDWRWIYTVTWGA